MSPTNETSPEEEDAPVEVKEYKYITWTKEISSKKRFKTKYAKECDELKALIIRLWPKVRGYHPEVIVRHKDGPNYLVDVADADDKDSEDKITLLPQGELPSKPKLRVAILDLIEELKSLDEDKSWNAVDLENVDAVEAETGILKERLQATCPERWELRGKPKGKPPVWHSIIEKTKDGRHWERIGSKDFDSELKMALWMRRQVRRALLATQDTANNDQPKRESVKKDSPKKDPAKKPQRNGYWVRNQKK
ncbi:hypothetical protein J4E83_004664 [Alternaria metachromatica]|uniref:uncharacterized protein n=1 Tax=Alternaria metachromatica TaxID=283354 RepID=UPI0020C3041C|nr:uncharacterized protein J4E83_004664 [Alternaria metachromatica]KAI4623272.1 hypothetical protein J4E83_004664 [Alternaria metachromatica]